MNSRAPAVVEEDMGIIARDLPLKKIACTFFAFGARLLRRPLCIFKYQHQQPCCGANGVVSRVSISRSFEIFLEINGAILKHIFSFFSLKYRPPPLYRECCLGEFIRTIKQAGSWLGIIQLSQCMSWLH